MGYQIRLTDAEMDTLGWAANRGYFPAETYDKLHLADGEPEETDDVHTERLWEMPEHAAWAILDLREDDPDALFACIGGELLEKLIALEMSIV